MGDSAVEWAKLECVGAAPSKRSGHSLTSLGGTSGLLFGGIDLKSPPGPNADLFSYDIGSLEIVWSKLEASNGAAPAPRWRHSAVAISHTQLVVFGGFFNGTTRLNDTWLWDVPSRTWSQPIVPTEVAEETISYAARKKASTPAFKPVHLAAIKARAEEEEKKGDRSGPGGGSSGPSGSSAFLEELGMPLDDPRAADAHPDAPSPRGAHSAVVVGEYMLVFGGYGGVGYQRKDFNDVHRLHLPTMTWVRTELVTGEPPATARARPPCPASRSCSSSAVGPQRRSTTTCGPSTAIS